MQTHNLTRTSAFRLTAAFGAMFAAAVILLLSLVYLQTAGFLSKRVDRILTAEASGLAGASPSAILTYIRQDNARDPLAGVSLFSRAGDKVAGPGDITPADIAVDGVPRDLPPHRGRAKRALAERLPWGETLIVERDTSQLVELRRTILGALLWSGAVILVLGAFLAVVLSLTPLRRVRATQKSAQAITAGDLSQRLPVNGSGDELDELARIVNGMIDEIERLVTQARTVGEGVAHELRTPLTRLRATLDHAADNLQADDPRRALLETCVVETDAVLARFRGLLRIAAVESRGRKSGIASISLSAVIAQAAELYEPLAVERQITLVSQVQPGVEMSADGELMFELVSNLLDNALKFTPPGGQVKVGLHESPVGICIEVRDNGPGVKASERGLVTQRFYRGEGASAAEGFGLGLSLVAAVAELHGFELKIEDGQPGLSVRLLWARTKASSPSSAGPPVRVG